jgi:monofunctional chorismate mutase
MVSIRGATTIENDTAQELLSGASELLLEIINANNLKIDNIIAIFFTCTRDLTSTYPAKAARDIGITHASLMCLQEMHVVNSLEKCIRICIFYEDNITIDEIKHVYMNSATSLRPDLVK